MVISGVVDRYSSDGMSVIGGKWEQAVIVDGMKRNVSCLDSDCDETKW